MKKVRSVEVHSYMCNLPNSRYSPGHEIIKSEMAKAEE